MECLGLGIGRVRAGGVRGWFIAWGRQGKGPLMVFRFSCWHRSEASDVMKLMNSDTHSCTDSFASLAIFSLGGNTLWAGGAMGEWIWP